MARNIRSKNPRRIYLREWRESVGWSAPQLADLLGMIRTSYLRLERAPHTLSAAELTILAEAFDIEPGRLWYPPGAKHRRKV